MERDNNVRGVARRRSSAGGPMSIYESGSREQYERQIEQILASYYKDVIRTDLPLSMSNANIMGEQSKFKVQKLLETADNILGVCMDRYTTILDEWYGQHQLKVFERLLQQERNEIQQTVKQTKSLVEDVKEEIVLLLAERAEKEYRKKMQQFEVAIKPCPKPALPIEDVQKLDTRVRAVQEQLENRKEREKNWFCNFLKPNNS